MNVNFSVNGEAVSVDVEPDTPLLWILRDHLGLTGTKFGCGMAMCGACTVHLDGARTFSCQIQAQILEGRAITTIEGLSPDGPEGDVHPIQQAWIDEQVPQCGFCQPGQMMAALDLLQQECLLQRERRSSPT